MSHPLEPTDGDLMRLAAAGDREAFGQLYRRHHAAVYRFARLMTGSNAVAEDVVQDVFLTLMKNASRYDESRASLSTYLYGVARRRTRRGFLRDRRFVALAGEESALNERRPSDDVCDGLARQNELQRLRRAILALPPRYREVIVLCDLQGTSYADAAAAIGCAVGTVRSRLHRARQLLSDKMQRALKSVEATGPPMRCPV
jgi:RNA polymerase sigma-70 factor (ECF subfamily)